TVTTTLLQKRFNSNIGGGRGRRPQERSAATSGAPWRPVATTGTLGSAPGACGSPQEPPQERTGAHRRAQDRFWRRPLEDCLSAAQKSNVEPANASGGRWQVAGGREGPRADQKANG